MTYIVSSGTLNPTIPYYTMLMKGHHILQILNPLDYYCIGDILQDLVYEGRQLPFASLQDHKEAIKNKWKEVSIETVQRSIAQWKNN